MKRTRDFLRRGSPSAYRVVDAFGSEWIRQPCHVTHQHHAWGVIPCPLPTERDAMPARKYLLRGAPHDSIHPTRADDECGTQCLAARGNTSAAIIKSEARDRLRVAQFCTCARRTFRQQCVESLAHHAPRG
jgi:hypothetical protein